MAAAASASDAVDEGQHTLSVDQGEVNTDGSSYHCIASTTSQDKSTGVAQVAAGKQSYFRDAKFSADGTSIIALCEGNKLRSYILPPDLLETKDDPKPISPYSETTLGTPVQSYATYPHYQLHDPSTTVYLAASRDQPIKLFNALYGDCQHASYPLIDKYTEVYLAPSSLVFDSSGQHFVAATSDRIFVFDIGRDGQESQASYRISSSLHMGGSSYGLIKTMSVDRCHRVLATGSLQRNIALFENEGLGGCIATFSLPKEFHGNGITGLDWSPDGTYLLAAERQSDCIQVFDIRYLRRHVSVLTGRKAKTSQVLGINVFSHDEGCGVWAGGTDGVVRKWTNPGRTDGTQPPDYEFKAHDNPVASAIWHPGGAVMGTCSAVDSIPRTAEIDSDSDSGGEDASDDVCGVIPLSAQHQRVTITPRAAAKSTPTYIDSLKIWSP